MAVLLDFMVPLRKGLFNGKIDHQQRELGAFEVMKILLLAKFQE